MNGQTELVSDEAIIDYPADSSPERAVSDEVDIVQLILRNKRLLSVGLAGGLLMGLTTYLVLGGRYAASSRILVSKKVQVPLQQDVQTTYGERAEHVALIMSPLIVGKAVAGHQLDELPSLAGVGAATALLG